MEASGGASLQAELERLSAELQEANEEKLQAARYGLAVLEESAVLKTKHSQLEEEHEALKLEVQQLREVSSHTLKKGHGRWGNKLICEPGKEPARWRLRLREGFRGKGVGEQVDSFEGQVWQKSFRLPRLFTVALTSENVMFT